jgi:hypothetical protein
VAVLDPRAERLTIVNDAIGAARLYEMRLPRGRIWSNRPGALPIFAGTEPAADERGWMILAAASWFLADSSPIEGVRRLAPATVVVADEEVSERRSKRAGEWVQAKRGELHELAREAASQAEAQARAAAEIWPGRADVDLSGGRDSRLSAAATVAAGIDARYQTSDSVPGEAKAAQAVIAAAPRELEHKVRNKKAGSATPGTPLLDRARNLHLLHDGVRHPQKLRGKMTLPRPRPNTATFSGHGGEIAHGFFYKNAAELRGARRKRGRSDRVMRFFAKDHEAATADAYAEARAAVESTFARGQEHGLRGAVLLDWFYLVDRFAHRSGIATDSERISVFATPAFVRAAFSLKPRDRLGNVLHDFVIASLVPEWSDVPFFEAKRSRMPKIRRHRLWEVVEDAAVVEDILAEEGPWSRVYDAERARASWNELKRGGGSAKWEPIFEGIVFRHTYDDHLRTLADAARADGKSLADALATNA